MSILAYTVIENPPNNTIYVNNLNERIRLPDLKATLLVIFSEVGEVLDVYAKKTLKLRGQAFVVFKNIADAMRAVETMQGLSLYSKPMRIQFSKTDSQVISRMKGASFLEGPPVYYLQTIKTMAERNKSEKPNRILFVKNIPYFLNKIFIYNTFKQFKGFLEIRPVTLGYEFAFVEYENEFQAAMVKKILNGCEIAPEYRLGVHFAKKL